MSVDLALRISGKLAGDWSASNVVGHLTAEAVDSLSAPAQWEALDPLVRTRLLLAPLFLRGAELGPLRPALRRLRAAAAGDQDEWVRATAAAVGDYDGALHMEALAKESKLVRRTLEDLRARLQGADPALSRPLEVRRDDRRQLARWPLLGGGAHAEACGMVGLDDFFLWRFVVLPAATALTEGAAPCRTAPHRRSSI
jgi:hypothetical protein